MKVLVTGGSGFIGKELIHKLRKKSIEVVNIDLRESGIKGIQEIISDLTCGESYKLNNVDACIHLASSVGGILFNQKSNMIDYNKKINRTVKKLCHENSIETLLFMSSINIFENMAEILHNVFFKEENKPKTNYAISKWEGEKYFYGEFSKYHIIRPTNVFGRSQIAEFRGYGESHVIPDLIDKIKRATKYIEVWGDGKQVRNFIHVSDLCDYIIKLLIDRTISFSAVNVRSDITITIGDLAVELLKIYKKDLKIKYLPQYLNLELMSIYNFEEVYKDYKIRSIHQGLLV